MHPLFSMNTSYLYLNVYFSKLPLFLQQLLVMVVLSVGTILFQYSKTNLRKYGYDAAILSQAHYNSGDGAIGSAYP